MVYFKKIFIIIIMAITSLAASQVVDEELLEIKTAVEMKTLYFETQVSPGNPYDPANDGYCSTSGTVTLLTRVIKVVEPPVINQETGLVIWLLGINGDDCRFSFPFDSKQVIWVNNRNLIIACVFYRNLSYFPPYDFGKYQIVDVLRGLGTLIEEYPQINKRRIYLYGGSGGGQLAMQTACVAENIFTEIYSVSGISRITTSYDVAYNGYTTDAYGSGWNVDLNFPTTQPSWMPDTEFHRYQAERALRSPQNTLAVQDLSTKIGIIHGDADPIVSFQHFLDLRSTVEAKKCKTVTTKGVVSTLDNWTFVQIAGGDHNYNVRTGWMDNYFPTAFTSVKSTEPAMSVDYKFPPQLGWSYHISGELKNCSLEMWEPPSSVGNWTEY